MRELQLVNPENPDLCDVSKSQWYTPTALAEMIVEWALSPFDEVAAATGFAALEPSAGRGALAVPLRQRVRSVTCVEVDRDNARELLRLGFDVYDENFLDVKPMAGNFDIVVMNPPFEAGQTEQHVLHALNFAPRVIAHVPLTTLAGKERREGLWSRAYLKRLVIHGSRPKYSGRRVGGMTDMCTIDVAHRFEHHKGSLVHVAASGVRVEWWP